MPFIPHTETDIRQMLDVIGVPTIETLFDEIPARLTQADISSIPSGLNEQATTRLLLQRAQQDAQPLCFLGAGAYEHHIPAAVWQIAARGEFYSAYTPYQAEASQGTLQLIYEYQSMMAHLTGMDVSNASLYDGGSALSEAVLMAVRANRSSKSRRILMPRTVHPHYRAATQAIVRNQDIILDELNFDLQHGVIDVASLPDAPGDFAALVIPQPNFFGALEDVDALTDWAHRHGALVIAVVNPLALALLKAPGQWGANGADIACGDGQPLGIPLSSGGPYFGFMCCKQAQVRQMPGRIVGRTVDLDGKTGYTLTLQAREQHIRRSKATSNICTNQGLMVTAATIHMALLGAEGLRRVALSSHDNLNGLLQRLQTLPGIERAFARRPFFHETVLRIKQRHVSQLLQTMLQDGVLGGLDLSRYYPELGNTLLLCVTETKTADDLDRYARSLATALQQ
ncbi:MAG: aminomethyl-transferring glycine dehydrogenase subunit GcvPA [Gammaproteobacteria bacterium]|nr:aminomethyl-transferring glycine dehydrogenase subunit GcvPA [Gammaproteobacteria bacterium]